MYSFVSLFLTLVKTLLTTPFSCVNFKGIPYITKSQLNGKKGWYFVMYIPF